jgi:glycosyltransferase involved in cell wall biosynthesis
MKLSVSIITYNQERFIGQAIESVLAQKVNFDYEIVVGEDCSTDSTRAVVMDLHRRYPTELCPPGAKHWRHAQPRIDHDCLRRPISGYSRRRRLLDVGGQTPKASRFSRYALSLCHVLSSGSDLG